MKRMKGIFTVQDARAEDRTSEEQEENFGNTSKMSSPQGKRPASPGYFQLPAKQQKLEQQFVFPQEDSQEISKSMSSDLNRNRVLFRQNTVEKETIKEKNNSYYSNNWENSIEDARLSKSNSSSDTEKYQIRYNLRDAKLKELRVILKDIKYVAKSGMETLLSEPDLWEVEKIVAKKEQQGVPTYLIKWKNWDSQYNTWEPVSNLVNCSDILEEFEKDRLKLLDHFKRKTNFYPNDRDIEEFLNHLKFEGKTLASISVDSNAVYVNIRNFLKQKYIKTTKLEKVLRRDILCMLIVDLRSKQLKSLKDWENEINIITNGKPLILVENMVDLEQAPQDFYYIEDYLPGNGVIIPNDPPIGCECVTCNVKTKCCFSQEGRVCPYTSTCKIRVPPGTPIYECNKRCACNMDCINRVVQRGTQMKLCIFRTANGRGWGVKTLQRIKKGSFVTEYVGEVITSEEAEKRGKQYDVAGRTYLFDLDYNETEEQCPYTVDAAMYGNISHFINHSCDPNLAVYGVWINCLDPNLPKLALFAMRDIKQDEEITFDYTCQSSRNNENSIKRDVAMKKDLDMYISTKLEDDLELHPEMPESDTLHGKTLCKCGAETCRRYLF
ncbi:histone-lysine N-methyltransferase SUV39H2-like [Xylocopa sonorina]|uniref:histone-lysine N-methyltransferase SUV39H2-like n=1 Tax=Xylocopa sonorina TaxID=1818115 RepID=UPI00403ABBD2